MAQPARQRQAGSNPIIVPRGCHSHVYAIRRNGEVTHTTTPVTSSSRLTCTPGNFNTMDIVSAACGMNETLYHQVGGLGIRTAMHVHVDLQKVLELANTSQEQIGCYRYFTHQPGRVLTWGIEIQSLVPKPRDRTLPEYVLAELFIQCRDGTEKHYADAVLGKHREVYWIYHPIVASGWVDVTLVA